MKKADLLELQRLLDIIKTEHPEYVIILTEDKKTANKLFKASHNEGEFAIELSEQVNICLADELNDNL